MTSRQRTAGLGEHIRLSCSLGRKAAKAFAVDYGAKWPKAAAKVIDDLDVLLAFYDSRPSTGSTCAPPTLLVRAGAVFENGKLVERPDESGGEIPAA